MERVTGIGGVFFRSGDPERLAAWHEQHFGVTSGLQGDMVWQQEAGPTVWAPFPQNSDYFARLRSRSWSASARAILTRCSRSCRPEESPLTAMSSKRPVSGDSHVDRSRHTQVRRLLVSAFTPRQVARVADRIEANARWAVDDIAELGHIDAVAELAALIPCTTSAT